MTINAAPKRNASDPSLEEAAGTSQRDADFFKKIDDASLKLRARHLTRLATRADG